MKNIVNMCLLAAACVTLGGYIGLGSGVAHAADPDCGYYDFENWNYEGTPPFVFTGTHVAHETYSFSGTVGAAQSYSFQHTFDVSPDGEQNVVWQLTYCLHIVDGNGHEAVYGRSKYLVVDENGDFVDASGDNVGDANPLYVTDGWTDPYAPQFPNGSDLNFYTFNDVGGTDDYMNFVFWSYGNAMDVTFSAAWRPYRLTCE